MGGEFVRIDDNESLEELELLVSNINAENQIVFVQIMVQMHITLQEHSLKIKKNA